MRLADLLDLRLTYEEVGASWSGPLPAGWDHLGATRLVGRGDRAFAVAGDAVLDFALQRDAGLRPLTTAPRAAVGVDLLGRLGAPPLGVHVPCRVVRAEEGGDRVGFAYGTLPGHPEVGEESFVVERRGEDVLVSVRAFSRPAHPALRLAGPVGHRAQRLFARRYLAVVAHHVARAAAAG